MDQNRKMDIALIRSHVKIPSLYKQLAEELMELGQALLKMDRYVYKDNPTPLAVDVLRSNIREELSDVVNVAEVLNLHSRDPKIKEPKGAVTYLVTQNLEGALQCAQCSTACLKRADAVMYLYDRYPYSKILVEGDWEIANDIARLIVFLHDIGYDSDESIINEKTRRWIDRLSE